MLFLHLNPFNILKFWFLVPLLNSLWGSRLVLRIVAENVSKSLFSIFSTVLEWHNSFLLSFCSRWGFTNLDILLMSMFSADLNAMRQCLRHIYVLILLARPYYTLQVPFFCSFTSLENWKVGISSASSWFWWLFIRRLRRDRVVATFGFYFSI